MRIKHESKVEAAGLRFEAERFGVDGCRVYGLGHKGLGLKKFWSIVSRLYAVLGIKAFLRLLNDLSFHGQTLNPVSRL